METIIKSKYFAKKMSELDLQYNILLVGATGAGKSSTINALFGSNIAKVGDSVRPETMDITSYSLTDYLTIWDSAGLGDGKEQDERHHYNIEKALSVYRNNKRMIDLVLVIVDGSGRDLGTTYHLLKNTILPNFDKDKVIILINQSDMAMKGRNWNQEENQPNEILKKFLDEKAISIRKRIKEATHLRVPMPIYYSAEKRFNLDKIQVMIYNNILNIIENEEIIKQEAEKRRREEAEKRRREEVEKRRREEEEEFRRNVIHLSWGILGLLILLLSVPFNWVVFGIILIIFFGLVYMGIMNNK